MLDNAVEVEQVRPLLPGSPACVAVVTNRDSLPGLVARDGARRLDLDLLPVADAVGLLRALVGERVDADPAAAEVLASRCSRLPLALRVAAELVAARPDVSLPRLAGELADQQRRLDVLEAGGDPRTAVRAVFSWSCRHLTADAARTFRLLGLHPGADLSRPAVAALTGTTAERAQQPLSQLTRAHLLRARGPTRYAMHDLLRAYAAEQADRDETESDRTAALTRLFDYYLQNASVAMDVLFPAERHRRPRITALTAPDPVLADRAAARTWLEDELANLVAVTAHTAGAGWPGHATRLAATLFRYLESGGHYSEAVTIYSCARRAADRAGDRVAEATALTNLGGIDFRQGRYQQSADHLEQALALSGAAGDLTGQARALHNLGLVFMQQGCYRQSADHFQRALAIYQQMGDRTGEARALSNAGLVYHRQGSYQQAGDYLREALALSRETGDRPGEAYTLGNLGDVCLREGEHSQAIEYYHHALELSRETCSRSGEVNAMTRLGEVCLRQRQYSQAVDYHDEALQLSREIGDSSGTARALNGLGDVLLGTGHVEDAQRRYADALEIAGRIRDRYEQARAHHGLAGNYDAIGDRFRAYHHWEQSLSIYTSLGVPEADQIRAVGFQNRA